MSWATEVINFLNKNSGAILAFTTVVYAVITGRMLYETKKMRQSQTEPDVFITVQPMERARFILNLVIQNIGPGAAYSLRFKVDPDIKLRSGRNLSEINFMKNGFRYLAPKQKLECIIASSIEEANKKESILHEISVIYKDKSGKPYEAIFVLDFTEHFGMLYSETDPLKGVIEKLDSIHKDIEKVSRSSGDKLRVVAWTKKEYEDDLKEQENYYKELEEKQSNKC